MAADLEQTLELVVELRGNELSVSLEGQRVAQVSELPPFEGKSVGIRCWGGPLHLDALRVSNGREDVEIRPESGGSPSERAFEALCLAVLNLNEFVYVD